MSYSTEDARRQLLEDLGSAADQLALALASLGEAYQEVDEATGETLEEQLFRPVRSAYATARRTATGFADRHALPRPAFDAASAPAYSADPRVHVQRALEATERTNQMIAEMQDSMLPVEVGDRELRDGLSNTRELISAVPAQARQLLRMIGR
jgi:hypothetical protein